MERHVVERQRAVLHSSKERSERENKRVKRSEMKDHHNILYSTYIYYIYIYILFFSFRVSVLCMYRVRTSFCVLYVYVVPGTYEGMHMIHECMINRMHNVCVYIRHQRLDDVLY